MAVMFFLRGKVCMSYGMMRHLEISTFSLEQVTIRVLLLILPLISVGIPGILVLQTCHAKEIMPMWYGKMLLQVTVKYCLSKDINSIIRLNLRQFTLFFIEYYNLLDLA